MPFDTLESSLEDGEPIYLYRFTLNSHVWRYTSADGDIEAGGALWLAVPIADDGVKQTGETATDALTITCSSSIDPARIYSQSPPSRPMGVAILRTHANDTDDIKTVYVGEVSQSNIAVPGTSTLLCETLSASMQREGLRLSWQRDCPYAVYDPVTCKLDKEDFAVEGTVSALADASLTVPEFASFADGYFAGGFLEWTDSERGIERVSIESHSAGGVLLLFTSGYGLAVAVEVTGYPGCARNTTACIALGNLVHYGGIPDLAGKSPFDGNPVFI